MGFDGGLARRGWNGRTTTHGLPGSRAGAYRGRGRRPRPGGGGRRRRSAAAPQRPAGRRGPWRRHGRLGPDRHQVSDRAGEGEPPGRGPAVPAALPGLHAYPGRAAAPRPGISAWRGMAGAADDGFGRRMRPSLLGSLSSAGRRSRHGGVGQASAHSCATPPSLWPGRRVSVAGLRLCAAPRRANAPALRRAPDSWTGTPLRRRCLCRLTRNSCQVRGDCRCGSARILESQVSDVGRGLEHRSEQQSFEPAGLSAARRPGPARPRRHHPPRSTPEFRCQGSMSNTGTTMDGRGARQSHYRQSRRSPQHPVCQRQYSKSRPVAGLTGQEHQ